MQPAAAARVTREGNRLMVRVEAAGLDLAPTTGLVPELVSAVRAEGTSLAIDLGPSVSGYRVDTPDAGRLVIDVLAAGAPPPPPPVKEAPKPVTPKVIRVGGNVQSAKLVRQPKPVYPPLARQARIQGQVKFTAVIGNDGTIQNLQLISGHPLLVQSAQDAVRQWVYQPTLLNGEPVQVITQIDVNFTLTQ